MIYILLLFSFSKLIQLYFQDVRFSLFQHTLFHHRTLLLLNNLTFNSHSFKHYSSKQTLPHLTHILISQSNLSFHLSHFSHHFPKLT
ncbi:hypothetical protein KFK09_001828 [Dendrobium nobile]|uniref:Uncharacterized protein n=1 Tax=Dendrobium nobile TaxID=94219 RepID=A0A8T3CBD1_DENNO|nr:hypothetical protein KFK09_001828 [Dendrobium nobile]